MKKKDYQPPVIELNKIYVEECIVAGSTITIEVTPAEETLRISEYDTYQEANKDLNINF